MFSTHLHQITQKVQNQNGWNCSRSFFKQDQTLHPAGETNCVRDLVAHLEQWVHHPQCQSSLRAGSHLGVSPDHFLPVFSRTCDLDWVPGPSMYWIRRNQKSSFQKGYPVFLGATLLIPHCSNRTVSIFFLNFYNIQIRQFYCYSIYNIINFECGCINQWISRLI